MKQHWGGERKFTFDTSIDIYMCMLSITTVQNVSMCVTYSLFSLVHRAHIPRTVHPTLAAQALRYNSTYICADPAARCLYHWRRITCWVKYYWLQNHTRVYS